MSTRAVAPWVRTRLRTAPGAAVALGVLVLVTAFLAAAFPRALDDYQDAGLRHQLDSAPAAQRILRIVAQAPGVEGSPEAREAALAPEQLKRSYQESLRVPAAPLRVDSRHSAYGVRTPRRLPSQDKWLPRLSDLPPMFQVTTRSQLPENSRLVEGRAAAHRAAPAPGAAASGPTAVELEAVVTRVTAKTLRIRPGAVVHLTGETVDSTASVRITGIIEPRAPESTYWGSDPVLHTPSIQSADISGERTYWAAGLLLPPDAAPALARLTPRPELFWELAPVTAGLTARDTAALNASVAALESGPGQVRLRELTGPETVISTDIEDLLKAYATSRAAVDPVVAVAAFGVGTVAAVVLLMAGALAGARRYSELALLRARGGSLRGMAGRLCAELAVVAVPAAAAGWLAAFLLLPDARHSASVLAASGVALLACAGLPVRAALSHLRPKAHGDRGDMVRAKPSRRRTVAELTLVVLTVGAVAALRRRGTAGEVDQLVSAAPVLVGVIASFVLIRLYPLPLRLIARPMALRRGAIGFLSAARAGRAPATAALPLLALLIALTTSAFGGSVLAGVSHSRDRAATAEVGADARLQKEPGAGFDERALAAVRTIPGVREVSPVGIDYRVSLPDRQRDVTLLAVDPASYARLSHRTGLGAFDAGALGGGGKGKAYPVLASPKAAQRLGGTGREVELRSVALGLGNGESGHFRMRVGKVVPDTPALREADFLVISGAAFPGYRPSALMVTGDDLDGRALRAAAGERSRTHLWSEVRAEFVSPPLQRGAERVYLAAVAAGAGYAVLAVLLSLLQAAPERSALLARLRTMGLTRGQGRRLLVFESLPQALLAACGGALVGWAAIRLLAPDIDLGTLALAARAQVGGAVPVNLRADAWSLLVPALAVVCIAAGVAAVQAWWTTRATAIKELRAGDAR